MPLFELANGHGHLAEPLAPADAAFAADAPALVADHLTSLLGEQLFPVRPRGAGTEPHLLALDAAVRPVVVDVVRTLDARGLVTALGHAGAAGRLSRADLSRLYHRGPDRFEADLAAYRSEVPLAAAAASTADVRLVLVCAEVDEAVVDAITFLGTGRPGIELLEVGVLDGPDGRRYVDVSPYPTSRSHRRAVEARSSLVASDAFAEPQAHLPAGRAAVRPEDRDSVPNGRSALRPEDRDSVPNGRSVLRPEDRDPPPGRHATPTRAVPTATVLPGPAAPAVGAPASRDGLAPDPALAALGRHRGVATELVWVRLRRGQRLVATLHADGLLTLPDGSVHADPDRAAAVASGVLAGGRVDGWRSWRIGADGPTLAEATGRGAGEWSPAPGAPARSAPGQPQP